MKSLQRIFLSLISVIMLTPLMEIRSNQIGNPEIAFAPGDHNQASPLYIDPALTWNTFLGKNNGTDYGFNVTLDQSGNVYVTGISNAVWGNPVRGYSGAADAFVAKLDASGNLMWNTFLGGSAGNDYGEGIVVDKDGSVYVTGLTDVSFGDGTWGNPIRAFMGQGDGFVAKLDSSGNLVWNTFLGSPVSDWGKGLTLTSDGSIYVIGGSGATWGNSIVRTYTTLSDAFVAKLDAGGNLIWTSFFGGNGFDEGSGITTDGNGKLYLTGFSTVSTGSATWGAPVHDYTAGGDAFVANVDSSGNLSWNTFLGGNGYEYGTEVAADGSGKIYITGISNTVWGNPVRDYTAGNDAFVATLDSKGNLTWNTFLGGNGYDYGYDIDVDGSGNVYVTGYSTEAWGNPVRSYTAHEDAFAVRLDTSGKLVFNTFLGGNEYDYGEGLDVDNNGTVYVTGSSTATWGNPVSAYTPPTDAFVVKLDFPLLVTSTSLAALMNPGPSSFTITFNKELNNPVGDTAADDATNPHNYFLIDKGANALADTASCVRGAVADDTNVKVTSVTYNSATLTSMVTLASTLPVGQYRLFVCGTTSIVDLTSNVLAGDGTTPGTDYVFDFTVNTAPTTSTSRSTKIPSTGFTPNTMTSLPPQPANQMYANLGPTSLEIPSQKLKVTIVGVPKTQEGWNVTWLGNNVGWLNGTAFPSWEGNSVLTAHVYNSNGLPGPFLNIKNLKYGDQIIVQFAGEQYIFEVTKTVLVKPFDSRFAFEHLEKHSYLTLITCEGYSEQIDSYHFRRVVRAVLVSVK